MKRYVVYLGTLLLTVGCGINSEDLEVNKKNLFAKNLSKSDYFYEKNSESGQLESYELTLLGKICELYENKAKHIDSTAQGISYHFSVKTVSCEEEETELTKDLRVVKDDVSEEYKYLDTKGNKFGKMMTAKSPEMEGLCADVKKEEPKVSRYQELVSGQLKRLYVFVKDTDRCYGGLRKANTHCFSVMTGEYIDEKETGNYFLEKGTEKKVKEVEKRYRIYDVHHIIVQAQESGSSFSRNTGMNLYHYHGSTVQCTNGEISSLFLELSQ